jgi:hypothetical protein
MMYEYLLYGILSVIFISFVISTIVLKKKNTNLTASIITILLENANNKSASEDKNLNTNEGFVKFLSDSRDWAFAYIEEVQSVLGKFISEVGPEIEYYRNFGQAVDSPNNESLDKISNAYSELEKVLPKDKKNNG